MTIPLIDLLTKAKARLIDLVAAKAPPISPPIARIHKPSDQRLSKTVLPNTARPRMPMDSFQAAAVSASKPAITSQRPVYERSAKSPAAKTVAPEPMVERTISLQLSEILDRLPAESIKAADSFDSSRFILLRASDLEKGMACGKPTVPLSSIYQQAPEMFQNRIQPGDTTVVSLPFGKVLDQFNKLQIRADQEHDLDVPQLETPFLQVTLEDTERFGTALEPLQASSLPTVKVEPAIAKTIAAAEPEPVLRTVALRPKIPLHDLESVVSKPIDPITPAPASTHKSNDPIAATPAPQKIAFHLPPNGTGVPASEKVPASSGPPVPISSELAKSTSEEEKEISSVPETKQEKTGELEPKKIFETGVPASVTPSIPRIPFKFTAPSDDIRPKLTLVPGVEPKGPAPVSEPTQPVAVPKDIPDSPPQQGGIVLSLQTLLNQVPAFQLNGSPMNVPEDAQIEFPLQLIEPQLASGRVLIPAKLFHRAIPKAHRDLFIVDANETPVLLPLQQVVKRLPSTALRMREDQEEVLPKEKFTTPFSIQAEEDAKRFNAMAAALENPPVTVETHSSEQKKVLPPIQPRRFEIDKNDTISKPPSLDAKTAAAQAKELPGVAACTITFADGLGLAGNISAELGAEGLTAMAGLLVDRIDSHISESNLGDFIALTLHCSESVLTFFKHGNICLTAQHSDAKDFAPETRARLYQLTKQLSQTYPEVELSHVDH